VNNAANQHQHHVVIENLKGKLKQLGSRSDDAGRFARAQFKAWIKRAEDRLAAFQKAEAAYAKVQGELHAAQTAYNEKRAALLAAVEAELAPFARRVEIAASASPPNPPQLEPFPWNYRGGSTEDLARKALHDPNGHFGANLGDVIGSQRDLKLGDMALAIVEEGDYAHSPNVTHAELAAIREAFEVRWNVWSTANRTAIAALGT